MAREQITLRVNQAERKALADYAVKNNFPSVSAALRSAMPSGIFASTVLTEGRPKKKVA